MGSQRARVQTFLVNAVEDWITQILTKVSLAAKTPPSNGVSLGPIIRASQVNKLLSEMGPVEVR